jgi:chlorobactene glucosyltransferase
VNYIPAILFESTLLAILTGIVWFLVFAWLVSLVLTIYGLVRQQFLSATLQKTEDDAPLVSVLVPARNEQHRVLEHSIRSILAQDYPRLEVIAVNDRSTDATGSILETLAKHDERLRVIDGKELPAGWLGKPYAMQQAVNHAEGEWILATDADMIFETSALRSALDHTLKNKGDAITLIPYFETGSFWERVMIPAWTWVFLMWTVFYRTRDPKSQGAAGIGGFFLMRRSALEAVGGYEALKDEVMEDVRLAEMIKRSGARLLLEHAPNLVGTRMYSNFSEMWECCTKNWFSGMKFSLPFALSCVLSMHVMSVLPPLIALVSITGIGLGVDLWHWFIPTALSWLLQVLVLAIVSSRNKVSPAYALTAPLGLGLLYAMLFDSTMRVTTGKGVTWKGRKVYESKGVRPPGWRPSATHVSNMEE